jgi:UDP-N-acetylglucosamine 1-carboxyvinyltransferase
MPGGCAIGTRPIDLHLKGFRCLDSNIVIDHGFVSAETDKLKGSVIDLDFPSVGATQNIVMAATLAKGTTVLNNAAKEPEIVDFVAYLNKMGAKITGEGTDSITIEGVEKLVGTEHEVMFDRIEAMTYMVAAAITKGDITLENVDPANLNPVTGKLRESGCTIIEMEDERKVRVIGPEIIKPVDITTLPHPGFPTDAQAQFMALNMLADGTSTVKETVFENRFMHVAEYNRMGADIKIASDGRTSFIKGVKNISGAVVKSTDLRAGASLILCGLVADGETRVREIQHVLRGYVDIQDKLKKLGANIELVDIVEA